MGSHWLIGWKSDLWHTYVHRYLEEGSGVSRENHRPVLCHWETLSHGIVSSALRHERDSNSQLKVGFELTNSVAIWTACIDICISNYHNIMTIRKHFVKLSMCLEVKPFFQLRCILPLLNLIIMDTIKKENK